MKPGEAVTLDLVRLLTSEALWSMNGVIGGAGWRERAKGPNDTAGGRYGGRESTGLNDPPSGYTRPEVKKTPKKTVSKANNKPSSGKSQDTQGAISVLPPWQLTDPGRAHVEYKHKLDKADLLRRDKAAKALAAEMAAAAKAAEAATKSAKAEFATEEHVKEKPEPEGPG